MFEFTTDQTALVLAVLNLLVIITQVLKRVGATPAGVKVLAYLANTFKFLPGSSDDWQRIGVGALAAILMALFGVPAIGALPAGAEFTVAYAILLVTWATNSTLNLITWVTTAHGLFHYLWKGIFKNAAKKEIPVLKELAPAAIKAEATKNA